MPKRTWMLLGVAALLTLTAASGVWAGLALAHSPTGPTAADCCLDPTCLPGCCAECPPDCLTAEPSAKTSCCPGAACSTDTPNTSVKQQYTCPPCPCCPGW
jgi:hypothetical protein